MTDECDKVDIYDIFSEWTDESGFEFENQGTACCPEYYNPRGLFVFE